jgi:type II secretory pathway pseudopilin PulG
MKLEGQARQDGYVMAALLVAMSVMAVMLAVAMPVWKQIAQREKEAELIFRGEQYARAVGLFQRKFANAAPPSIDLLVEQKFLRKKYKDPITNDDFVPVLQGQAAITAPGQTGPSSGSRPGTQSPAQRGAPPGRTSQAPGAATGGIVGVSSKSTETSIRLYKGRSHYNEWQFVYAAPAAAPGQGAQQPGQQQRQGGPPGPGPTQLRGTQPPGPARPGR